MEIVPDAQNEVLLSAELFSVVQEKLMEWLDEQNRSGEFESSWTDAGRLVGGSFVNVNSSEELAAALFE